MHRIHESESPVKQLQPAPGSPGSNTLTVEAKDYAPAHNTTTKAWSVSVSVTGGTARTLTYDFNGNMLGDGTRTYEWDAENRLVKITQGGVVTQFGYDGQSRRVSEAVNGALVRRWVWCGTELCEERDGAGSVVKRFYPEGEQWVTGANAGSYYYTRDHLGSIRELTDASVTVRARYDYDVWGARGKLGGDLDASFGFTGHYQHASGLILALYRAYDPELGRWISEDPIGIEGGINVYGYVGNGVASAIDILGFDLLLLPDGRDAFLTSRTQSKSAYEDVDGHGSPNSFLGWDKQSRIWRNYSPDELASKILKDPRYRPGQPVRLNACNTGAPSQIAGQDNFARQLATALTKQSGIKTEVYAPNGYIQVNDKGTDWNVGARDPNNDRIVILGPNYYYKTFSPRK